MRVFTNTDGQTWVAKAVEEDTPRHHGTWYLVFHPESDAAHAYAVPEIRWQNAATAARTLTAMSEFELRRRANSAVRRGTVLASTARV
jgi:hypothetical protein